MNKVNSQVEDLVYEIAHEFGIERGSIVQPYQTWLMYYKQQRDAALAKVEKLEKELAEFKGKLREVEQEHNLVAVRDLKIGDTIWMPNRIPDDGTGEWITIEHIGELSDRVHLFCDDDARFHSVRYHQEYKVHIKEQEKADE